MPTDLTTATNTVARSIKAHREARGWSLGALAKESGLSKTLLSKLEAGLGNPSLETLVRLARTFDIALGTLLGEDEPPQTQVIRAVDGPSLTSESGMGTRLILAEGRAHRTEIYEIYLLGGMEYASRHQPRTEELVLCLEGSLEAGPEGQEVELRAGDALWFPGDLPHRYRSRDGARALSIMSYPSATPR